MALLAIFPLLCLLRVAVISSSSSEELPEQELSASVEFAVSDLPRPVPVLGIAVQDLLRCREWAAGLLASMMSSPETAPQHTMLLWKLTGLREGGVPLPLWDVPSPPSLLKALPPGSTPRGGAIGCTCWLSSPPAQPGASWNGRGSTGGVGIRVCGSGETTVAAAATAVTTRGYGRATETAAGGGGESAGGGGIQPEVDKSACAIPGCQSQPPSSFTGRDPTRAMFPAAAAFPLSFSGSSDRGTGTGVTAAKAAAGGLGGNRDSPVGGHTGGTTSSTEGSSTDRAVSRGWKCARWRCRQQCGRGPDLRGGATKSDSTSSLPPHLGFKMGCLFSSFFSFFLKCSMHSFLSFYSFSSGDITKKSLIYSNSIKQCC